jgi:tetratricopeptide (TPR) repeat protein
MGDHFERAQVLFEQSRYELCERVLRQELAEQPGNPMAHALLGLCLAATHQGGALEQVREAIQQAPDLAFAYYALADVLHDREDLDGAAEAIREALRLDPAMPNYHALQAGIAFKAGRWAEALAAAERGLAIDAGHVGCANLRALALINLRRPEEAGAAIASALARDPDHAVTHANQGWALLHRGDSAAALYHFREALRLDADFEAARQGVIEAFKARYLLYQLLLRFVLWMSRLSRQGQGAVFLAGVFGYVAIEVLGSVFSSLRIFTVPVQAVCVFFAVLIWIADPLFNLVLRLDPLGRAALTPEQVRASDRVGFCLLGAAAAALVWVFTRQEIALDAAGLLAALTLPAAGISDCPPGWRRLVLMTYTLVVLVAGVVGLTLLAARGHAVLSGVRELALTGAKGELTEAALRELPVEKQSELLAIRHGIVLAILPVIGAFLSPWLVLLLLPGKPRR